MRMCFFLISVKSSDGCRAKKSRNRDRPPAQGFIFLQGWIKRSHQAASRAVLHLNSRVKLITTPRVHRIDWMVFYSNASVWGPETQSTVHDKSRKKPAEQ